MRLGILGGSFDPIHNAHLIAAQLAREALALDRVLLVVSAHQPLKRGHGASARERLAMVRLAVAGIPGLEADDREIRRGGASYTVDTLREVAAEAPGAELVLLLGSDAALDLPHWREPEAIRKLARVVVFARQGAPAAEAEVLQVPPLAISSTAVRERLRAGLGIRGWVPDGVADYISGLALYQAEGGTE